MILYDLIFTESGIDKTGKQLYKLSPSTRNYEGYSEKARKMSKPLGFWKRYYLKRTKTTDPRPSKKHQGVNENMEAIYG